MASTPAKEVSSVPRFIIFIRGILQNLLGNQVMFANPTPAIATVTTNVNTLETAQTVATTRVIGSKANRDVKLGIAKKNLTGIKSYVQGLADAAPDEVTAIAIIKASGFDLKNNGKIVKPDISAKNGDVSGSAKIICKSAGARSAYHFRHSIDEVNWVNDPTSLQAKTVINGLTPGVKTFFQYQPITKDGEGDWSQSVWIYVH